MLSFSISPFTSPAYNLPIFLFGMYAQDNTEGIQSLQTVSKPCDLTFHVRIVDCAVQFTGLVGVSAIFDIIYMARNEQNWFIRAITILILILKVCLVHHWETAKLTSCTSVSHILCVRTRSSPKRCSVFWSW